MSMAVITYLSYTQDLAAIKGCFSKRQRQLGRPRANTLILRMLEWLRAQVSLVAAAAVVFSLGGLTGWTFPQAAMADKLNPAGSRQLSLEQQDSLYSSTENQGLRH